MAQTPEGRVKKKVRSVLDALGAWYYMPAASPYGRRGIPDFVICANGQAFFIETKANKKGRLTGLQALVREEIEMANGGYFLVYDDETLEQAGVAIRRAMDQD